MHNIIGSHLIVKGVNIKRFRGRYINIGTPLVAFATNRIGAMVDIKMVGEGLPKFKHRHEIYGVMPLQLENKQEYIKLWLKYTSNNIQYIKP